MGNRINQRSTSSAVLETFRQQAEQGAGSQLSVHERVKRLSQRMLSVDPFAPHDPAVAQLIKSVREESARMISQVHFQDVGTVQHIGNGVATLSGLPLVHTDELVTFPTGVQGLVLSLDHELLDVILLGPDEGIRGGDLVTASGERIRVPVGPKLLGRVVDPLGKPLDSPNPIEATAFHNLEQDAPGIIERSPVNQPLQTGLKIVDGLLTIGRGQRELIIGDRRTGKTSMAVDAILNQHESDVSCVYVAIGQKKSTTLAIIETLRKADALEYTTVMLASPDDPPALRYLAPYAGCTMAEYPMKMGQDVLIVYDDLSKHAEAYRELSLLLRRPPGREAYPGDIFYLHARLLERAAKLNEAEGDGSLTALPIVEIHRGNLTSYIPTNLISITDGQIVLDADAFNRGVKPAVDVGRSVSRVGGAAQTPAMRAVAGKLRLELAQFDEVSRFARFGTELDETTQRQIERGRRLQAALTQPVHQPLSLALQVLILFAVTEGHMDDLEVEDMTAFESKLIRHFETNHSNIIQEINRHGKLTETIRSAFADTVGEVRSAWLGGIDR